MATDKQQRSLDDLTPTEFEEFCFDLLESMGYVNLKWRKGTGHSTSPADGGRDIECDYPRELPDGRRELEKWFVECKHGKDAVAKERILGFLSAASALRPDKALIIASNYLSNAATDWLADWKENNKPAFSIGTWERKDLERQMSGKIDLLRKYGLAGDFPVLTILHPAHVRYLKLTGPNTLRFLFDILDNLPPTEQQQFIGGTMFYVINPRFADPPPGYKGTLGELMLDVCNYQVFKAKCYDLAKHVCELFLVKAIVNDVLNHLLHAGDYTSVEMFVRRHQEAIDFFRKRIADGKGDRRSWEDAIARMETMKRETPTKTREAYAVYVAFCEKALTPLLAEKIEIQFPPTVEAMRKQIGLED